ncbi:hypothetical protein RHMOL_Rhmol09G0174100 [Rhododendron molle]|uniref:Uncharacterized protein n=1 Tax=Rhododendron molle TaxID=49168 RepID=A0ACC0MFI8_RHOML|nr:hypothetical protein RHMOL_Rhmol09G0174100 [Rhododendron molle]
MNLMCQHTICVDRWLCMYAQECYDWPGRLEQLRFPLLYKLAESKKCHVTHKANTCKAYAGISQCRFNVHSISSEDTGKDL